MAKTMMINAALVLASCGTDPLPAGAVCSATDDCEASLTCLDVAQVNSSGCTVVGKACSIVCTDDSSCSPLGTDFKCFTGCGSEKFCGKVGR
jgi:hypothetical protein